MKIYQNSVAFYMYGESMDMSCNSATMLEWNLFVGVALLVCQKTILPFGKLRILGKISISANDIFVNRPLSLQQRLFKTELWMLTNMKEAAAYSCVKL